MILHHCISLFIRWIYVFKWLTMRLRIININTIYTIIYFFIGNEQGVYTSCLMRIYVLGDAYIRLGEFLYTSWRIPVPALANSRTCVCEFLHLRLRIPAPAFGGACIGNGLTAVQTAGRSLLHRPSFSLSPRVRRTIPRDASALSRIYNFHGFLRNPTSKINYSTLIS